MCPASLNVARCLSGYIPLRLRVELKHLSVISDDLLYLIPEKTRFFPTPALANHTNTDGDRPHFFGKNAVACREPSDARNGCCIIG